MNITFSLKLFIAFIIFGIVLFFSSFFLSYEVFNKKIHNENVLKFTNDIDGKQKNIQDILSYHKFLIKQIVLEDEFKEFDKNLLSKKLKTLIIGNKELLQVSILKNSDSKEIIKLKKQNKKVLIEKIYFDKLRDFEIFTDILKLKKGLVYFSSLKLDKEDADILSPLKPISYFAIKDKNYTVITKVDMRKFLDSLSYTRFIIDDKTLIYDRDGNYSWSRYFYDNLNLKNVLLHYSDNLLINDSFVTNDYYFKKLYLTEKKYLNIVLDSKSITFKEFLYRYKESIYAVTFLNLVLALILAMVFTTPLSNINRKLINEKDSLNDSMEKNKLILNDTLELINEYVMYLKIDTNWNIIDVSSYLCRVSGFQKSELIGHKYKKFLNSKSFDKFENNIIKALEYHKVWRGDLLGVKKHGDEYWVSSRIEADYDANGQVVSYTEIRTDIDDKKRIEKLYNDLNYQIEQLNVIFQNANSGIALIDIEGNFKRFNEAFLNMFQYTESELVNNNFFQMTDESSESLLFEITKELKDFDSISNVELIFLTKNNEEIYLDVSLRMLPDKLNIVLVINSLEDKRKLQELNQTLEQRVTEEVRKNIEKDKLHQDQQIKNAKLTSIGTLAAGITHEINTPLTYLKGNFEILQMDIEDLENTPVKKDMIEGCEKIDEAINRIAVIVESMREMSQSSSEIKEKSNIYATLITSLTMAYNVSKQISKIYLNNELFTITNIDKNKFEFLADVQKQRIEQVWIIIINNALDELKKIDDYEKREFRILVYEDNDEVIVKFQDNAGGIKEDIIHKIFDPFISTKQHSGMGVGLNIAKKIVDEHEGKILAYNSDDGAVFEVRLKKTI